MCSTPFSLPCLSFIIIPFRPVRIINAAECEKMQRPTNNNNSSNNSPEMRTGHKLFTTVDCNTPKMCNNSSFSRHRLLPCLQRPEINFFPPPPARVHSSLVSSSFKSSRCACLCKSADSLQVRSPVGCKKEKCQVPPSPTARK